MLGLDGAYVVEARRISPLSEPRDVALVLRHRVRRAAVGLELDEEPGEGGGEAHGLELGWVASRATVAMDARGEVKGAPRCQRARLIGARDRGCESIADLVLGSISRQHGPSGTGIADSHLRTRSRPGRAADIVLGVVGHRRSTLSDLDLQFAPGVLSSPFLAPLKERLLACNDQFQ